MRGADEVSVDVGDGVAGPDDLAEEDAGFLLVTPGEGFGDQHVLQAHTAAAVGAGVATPAAGAEHSLLGPSEERRDRPVGGGGQPAG